MYSFNRRSLPHDSLLIHGAQFDLCAREEMAGRILIILLRLPLIVDTSDLRRASQDRVDVNPDVLIILFEGASFDRVCRLH